MDSGRGEKKGNGAIGTRLAYITLTIGHHKKFQLRTISKIIFMLENGNSRNKELRNRISTHRTEPPDCI